MHETIVQHRSDGHKGKSYQIIVMKTGGIITNTKKLIQVTPISVEDYFRKDIPKTNRPQADDKFNELIDCFVLLNQHEYLNILKGREKT